MDGGEDAWMAAMRRGDFAQAWQISDRILADRVARGDFDHTLPRHLQAVWDGCPLAGKRVLVRCYHGLGDTIQFIRFAKPLRKIAREVSVWVQAPLMPLVAQVEGIDRVLPLHEGAPDLAYDADIEIMELAHALRVRADELARDIPYIHVGKRALPPSKKLRIGLIWSAGDWDRRRSLQFDTLAPLLQIPNIDWIVLQRGPPRAEAQQYNLQDLGSDDIETFAATLRALDLLVCVDTFGAHLAAGMNVPVWVMLQQQCDWRWMNEGSTSPWYPSMRLFRQRADGHWTSVIADIADALTCFSSKRTSRLLRPEQSQRCDVRTE